MDNISKVLTSNEVMGLLLGLVAPPIISALKNKSWEMWKKMATVGAVSVILAAITLYLTTQHIEATDLKQVAVWTLATAIPAYKLIWEGTTVDQKATELNIITATKDTVKETVEDATDGKKE